jgi:hypothetical protein
MSPCNVDHFALKRDILNPHITYHICTPLSETVQVEVACSSKTLVSTVKSTQGNNAKDHNLNPLLVSLPILWFCGNYKDV